MGDLISRENLLNSLPKNDTVLSLNVRKIVLDAPAVVYFAGYGLSMAFGAF